MKYVRLVVQSPDILNRWQKSSPGLKINTGGAHNAYDNRFQAHTAGRVKSNQLIPLDAHEAEGMARRSINIHSQKITTRASNGSFESSPATPLNSRFNHPKSQTIAKQQDQLRSINYARSRDIQPNVAASFIFKKCIWRWTTSFWVRIILGLVKSSTNNIPGGLELLLHEKSIVGLPPTSGRNDANAESTTYAMKLTWKAWIIILGYRYVNKT